MKDDECVRFLQWALPRLQMRWEGFRKIRSRVCKRIQRRIASLELSGAQAYRDYLQSHVDEWQKLDQICQVNISRFYRDRQVFAYLAEMVLPVLCQLVQQQHRQTLRVWSVGCASGEEPYTLALVWAFCLQQQFPQLELKILATDTKTELLNRARDACYPFSSVRNLPASWREAAFTLAGDSYCLKPEYQQGVIFQSHDVRQPPPAYDFDLVLCRNLAFTYYDQALQLHVKQHLFNALRPAGVLVLGAREILPREKADGLAVWSERYRVYRKHQ